MGYVRYTLNQAERNMIIQALNEQMGHCRDMIDREPDGSPSAALAEVILETRGALATKINDAFESGAQTIRMLK